MLGLAVFALWELVLRRPLTDLSPRFLRERLPPGSALTRGRWVAAALSVVLGALTHVVWDTFTHRDRWGTTHVAFLSNPVGPLPLFKWFQFGSGIVGLAGLGLWLAVWVHRTRPRPVPERAASRTRYLSWALLLAAFVVVGALSGIAGLADGETVEATAVGVATSSISAGGAALLAVCAAWHASGRRLGHPGGVGESPAQGRER